jgi:hypothetical protein
VAPPGRRRAPARVRPPLVVSRRHQLDIAGRPGQEWADAVYRDKSLITRIGPLHADQAGKQDRPDGRPTSSSTMPGLVVSMYRHAMIGDGMDVLDVGTGSGCQRRHHGFD